MQGGPGQDGAEASPTPEGPARASKPWMRVAVFATALALSASAGIGFGALTAHAPPTVPLAFYITDAPAQLTALEVTVASVTAGPDRFPLEVKQGRFDLAALQGPDAAVLLAQGNVPADAVGAVEVTFASARATVDGHTFDVPLVQTLVVEGIRGPATTSPTFLLDVDLPASLVVGPDGQLAFAPVAAAVFSATDASGASTWTPAEAAPPVPLDLGAADITVPSLADPGQDLVSEAQPGGASGALDDTAALAKAPGWLVVYHDEPTRTHMRSVAEDLGAVYVSSLESMPVAYVLATKEQADMIAQHPEVERIEAEVPIVYDDAESRMALRMPDLTDPLTGLLDDQGRPIDGRGVGVAVVDSGLDGLHPAFQRSGLGDSVVADNRKVVSQAFIPMENTDTTSGHGTHVAAIVAGQGGLDPALRGIAPGSNLYGLGIGEASTTVWAAQAFDWILGNHDAVDPPIRVVTNSWSAGTTYNPDSVTTRLVDRMVAQGIVVVFSAGNLGGDGSSARTSAQCQIPTPGVICVAAYDDQGNGTRDGTVAPYSSRGLTADPSTWPDVSAPGTAVMSARPLAGTQTGLGLGYVELSGTSQAAPHVAGLAALMLQADGTLLPAQVEAEMKASAYAFTHGGAYADGHHAKGHGLVDAYAAVTNVR